MNTPELTLKSVQKLLNEHFYVPAYQRGYRWSSEEVEELLNDLYEFKNTSSMSGANSEKQPFYCLQPVVVKKVELPSEGGESEIWEVIDGQQRLTTILLILHYLNETAFKDPKPIFSIKYETRGHINDALTDLNSDDFPSANVDNYHLHKAYLAIGSWFEEKSKGENIAVQYDMYSVITTRTEVIWYDISNTNESAIEVFSRLNIGKIPLTNAELIKALFLRKANFEEDSATLKQLQIASEWDLIENTLQDDDFWYFIYNKDNPVKYDTRIEFIFDLMYDRRVEYPDRYTYNKFAEEFHNLERPGLTEKIDYSWLQVKRYFLTIEQWYKDPKWYHLVGYLIATGESLRELKEGSENKTKDEFKTDLHSRIKATVNVKIDKLDYNKSADKRKIWNVLLLFNVQTILRSDSADIRFPFHRLKSKDWDIEHIASQTDISFRTDKQRKAWIEDAVDYLTGQPFESIKSEQALKDLLTEDFESLSDDFWDCYNSEKIEEQIFDSLRSKIENYFKEDSIDPERLHGIGNLTLLDEETNRSYKNALFPIKRKRIIKNDSTGIMVPLCTKNVFTKLYSNRLDDLMYWQDVDIDAYIKAIKETLKEYLPKTSDNEE